jgi:hypothetical protein
MLEIRKYQFEVTGLTPLILHRDDVVQADAVNAERKRIKSEDKSKFSAGDDRCPPWTWRCYLHHDGKQIALPNDMLRGSLRIAGSRVELKGKRSYKSATVSAISFTNLHYPLLVQGKPIPWASVLAVGGEFDQQAEAVKKLGFELQVLRVPVGMSKHVRVRPIFQEWSLKGTFALLDTTFPEDVLKQIWTLAGMQAGLGDQRPSAPRTPGSHGIYKVEIVRAKS